MRIGQSTRDRCVLTIMLAALVFWSGYMVGGYATAVPLLKTQINRTVNRHMRYVTLAQEGLQRDLENEMLLSLQYWDSLPWIVRQCGGLEGPEWRQTRSWARLVAGMEGGSLEILRGLGPAVENRDHPSRDDDKQDASDGSE